MPRLLPIEEDDSLRGDRELPKVDQEDEEEEEEEEEEVRRRRLALPIRDFTMKRLSSGRPKCLAVAAGNRCCPSAMCSTRSVSIKGFTIHTPPLHDFAFPSSGFWKNLLSERTCRTEFLHVERAVWKYGKFRWMYS